MYKNKITGAVLTDQEYWRMREKEVRQLWEDMDEEERQEWKDFTEFKQWDFERNVDLDYKYIES